MPLGLREAWSLGMNAWSLLSLRQGSGRRVQDGDARTQDA